MGSDSLVPGTESGSLVVGGASDVMSSEVGVALDVVGVAWDEVGAALPVEEQTLQKKLVPSSLPVSLPLPPIIHKHRKFLRR